MAGVSPQSFAERSQWPWQSQNNRPRPHQPDGYPDALAPSAGFGGVEHTDGQAGRLAKASPGPLGAQQPVRLCKCLPGEGGGWRWGVDVDGLLSGS